MRAVLQDHIGETIGINIDRPHHVDAAELLFVTDSYFSVKSSTDGHTHHIPYSNVLKAIEDRDGVEIKHLFTVDEHFNIIVKIRHVVAQMIA